ncbi:MULTISPECIES: amidase [unclassified Delftia]|uniref:amidase n=1 Tax=unclassified Delftia TaxID=2613839 RepID=UPI0006461EAC|nr:MULTISPECIES: amidase [unclassified Delftia]MDC2858370.1 amidase [Delftia sp. DT-2]
MAHIPSQQSPQLSSAPWRWTAVEMAAAVRRREISAKELVQSCLDRIEQVNPLVNALSGVSAADALEAAAQADQQMARGADIGPLHGVPVPIKINTDQKGQATSSGIVAFKDMVATEDAPPVANLRKAGAIFVGRSNSPPFALRWATTNDLHGRTLNPWDAGKTPGGSSGGAAAAIATGMVALAHGNDIGGSIRQPAFCCGVVGLRPTVGRIPSWTAPPNGHQPLSVQNFMTQGPLARCVADLRLALSVMSAPDPRDCLQAPAPLSGPALNGLPRVGLLRDVGIAQPSPAVNAALDEAAAMLREAGHVVEEVELPLMEQAYRLWWLLAMGEFRNVMPLLEQTGDDGIRRAAACYYEVIQQWCGPHLTLEAYIDGYARRGTLIAQLQQFMERWPLILLPTCTEQAFEQEFDIRSVDTMRGIMASNWSMMAISLLGFPALAVPTGIADGLPVGVQIVGPRFREDLVLDAAQEIERRAGRFSPITPL